MTEVPRPALGTLVAEFTDDGYDLVVHHVGQRSTHRLTGTAAALWLMVDGTSDVGQIVADLAEAYGTDPAAIAADVTDALDRLADRGLLAGDTPEPHGAGRVVLPRPADP